MKSLFPDLLSSSRQRFDGLPVQQTVAVGTISSLLILLCVGFAATIRRSWPLQLALLLVAGAQPFLLVWWFRWYLDAYVKRIRKSDIMARRSRKRIDYLESILQDSSDIIFTIDTEGYVLKFNKGSELHFGYSQAEIVGKPLVHLFVNEADERKILSNVLLNGKTTNEETPMKTKDGEVILLNLSMSEMKNDAGEIIGLVITAKDITEMKKLELELRRKNELLGKLAITDTLTELYNVRHFYDQIKREIRRLRRNPDRKLSLIMIDIDHFKELNDTEGHQVGDQVLKSLAQVITVCIRKDVDSGFRYGGDELVVILPDTDKLQARNAAERIQKQFGAFKFGRTSLSIGIAEARSDEDEKKLVKRADEAMYQSKRLGRARITIA
ncbi:MAG: diguanylate cyclase [Chitinivibrionales bacterium]|nr:diguanylate cyclase [Chitinivibrionales bacterium]MBD3394134.1 diguanylate cyclase [Chitinivibrionales bacterium]